MRTLIAVLLSTLPSTASAGSGGDAIARLLDLDQTPTSLPYVDVTKRGSILRGVVADVVPLSLKHVLEDVVLCYDAYPEWYPNQVRAEVRSRSDRHGQVYGEVQLPWPLGRRDYVLEVTDWQDLDQAVTTWHVDFNHLPDTGNIRSLSGRWLLQQVGPDTTVGVQDASVDFNMFIPGFIVRLGTYRYLPSILNRLKARKEQCSSPL